MQSTHPASVTTQLREALEARGMSQAKLAMTLGVTQMWVQRRLSGATRLTVDDLVAICGALGLDPRELLPAPPAAPPAAAV